MVYVACTSSPVVTEFYRQLGASEFHFGVIGALPLALVVMQYAGAALCNRLRRRKLTFIVLVIVGRLVYLPIAFAGTWLAGVSQAAVIWLVLALITLSHVLVNLSIPLWFNWMADLIPKKVLGRYWGTRQKYMQYTWMVTYLAVTGVAYATSDWSVAKVFQVLAVIGCVLGTIDILLFLKVPEPAAERDEGQSLGQQFLAPLRDRQFRSVLIYGCAFYFAAMLAAAFMQLYLLKVIQLPLWQANLVFCTSGLGAAAAPLWGRVIDAHGHRPVFKICTAFKPLIAIVFLLLTPGTALLVLPPALLFDSLLNAGNVLAMNSYMLKTAPRENRSMFIAAILALTGICGGMGALCGGQFLTAATGFSVAVLGRELCNYQLLFAVSACLRIGCIFLAHRIHEPESSSSLVVLHDLRGVWPLRVINFPVGLYRRFLIDRDDLTDGDTH